MGKVTVEIQGSYFTLDDRAEIYKTAERLSEVTRVEYVKASSIAVGDQGEVFNGPLDYCFTINLEREGFPGLGKLVRTIRFGAEGRWAVFFDVKDIEIFQLVPEDLRALFEAKPNLLKNWALQRWLIERTIKNLMLVSGADLTSVSISALDLQL